MSGGRERSKVISMPTPLAVGGGGPHHPDMEMRVARLEEDMRAVRTDLSAMRADTSYIRGRVESLPTTWSMIGTMIAGNVALVGLLVAAARRFGHP
jgi:hypothetical protein